VRATASHGVYSENVEHFAALVDAVGERAGFLTPEQYFAVVDGTTRPERDGVFMTFDDGLRSSYEFIAGKLTPRGIRVLFFVPTVLLGLSREEPYAHALQTRFRGEQASLREEEYLPATEDQLRELAAQGHGVMPHSHSHALLRHLADAAYEREIVESRRVVESLVPGAAASAFAIPYGNYRALSRAGYRLIAQTYAYCFTAIGGTTTASSNRLLLRRDNFDQVFSHEHVAATLDGAFDRKNDLKAALLRARVGLPLG
jgi:peptidoglycan/xylan/chitin deacetylase (PgdA/CDA1 family)